MKKLTLETLQNHVGEWNRFRAHGAEIPNLEGVDFREANLISANLSEANLVNADFRGANLSEANLVNAYLGRANFSRANLSGARIDAKWFKSKSAICGLPVIVPETHHPGCTEDWGSCHPDCPART